MIYHVFGFKNRVLGTFDVPLCDALEGKDYVERLSLSLQSQDVKVLARYKEFDIYDLGTLDSKSGQLVANCEFIASLEPICVSLIDHLEKSYGGKENA